MIITFANQKGGVGKSTIAYNFAYYLGNLYGRDNVMFIDTDAQTSIYDLISERKTRPPFNFLARTNVSQIPQIRDTEFCLIDTGGIDAEVNREFIRESDIVIIPTLLSSFDFNSTKTTIGISKENKALGYNTKFFLLFNRVKGIDLKKNALIQKYQTLIKEEEYPVKILKNYIKDSVNLNRSVEENESVFENIDTKNSNSAKELRKVFEEILEYGKQ